MSPARIGVLVGGALPSDASTRSGQAIVEALESAGRDAVLVRLGPGIDTVRALEAERLDSALLALDGRLGEEGSIQGLLEVLGIAYTGSSVMSSALAMDKLKSKELFRLHNVPTPPYYTVDGPGALENLAEIHGSFGFPVVVKPRREGSGVGVSKANDLAELTAGIGRALSHDDSAIVERFIAAREVHVMLLNGLLLGGAEVMRSTDGALCFTDAVDAANFSAIRYRGILNLGERAAQALDASGPVRVDVLVTEGQNEYVLDVNTMPSLAPDGLFAEMAARAGYCFTDLCTTTADGARLHTAPRRQATVTRVRTAARSARAERVA